MEEEVFIVLEIHDTDEAKDVNNMALLYLNNRYVGYLNVYKNYSDAISDHPNKIIVNLKFSK